MYLIQSVPSATHPRLSSRFYINYGFKYGLVGRNGVGKTSLLRAIANGELNHGIPEFLNVVHVEQEIAGDDRSALQTVLDADKERSWLLKQEVISEETGF